MLNPPPKQAFDQLPRLYATEHTSPDEIMIHMHFFCGPCDWFVAEHRKHDGEHYLFGFVNLGDPINAEWGQFKLSDLQSGASGTARLIDAETKELMAIMPVYVEWDEYWEPKKFGEIKGPWQRYR